MRDDEVISSGSFSLQRQEIFDLLQAPAELAEDASGFWRRLRIACVMVIVPAVLTGILLDRAPWMQLAFALAIVFWVVLRVCSWKIKRSLEQSGSSGPMATRTVNGVLEARIFKGRDSVLSEARFSDAGFELVQDNIRFSAGYDEIKKIGAISERNGLLQIMPGNARSLPDTLFLIPLSQMSQPQALMNRLRASPCFVQGD